MNIQTSNNGIVYACWAVHDREAPFTEKGIGFNKSTNGGLTWGTAHYAINNIQGMRSNPNPILGIRTNSFPVMGVDMQIGRIYIAWVNIGIPGINNGDPDVYLIYSDDQGTNWSIPKRVNTDPIDNDAIQFHCWLSVDPINGNIVIGYYDNRDNINTNICNFYILHSTDKGISFTDNAVSSSVFEINPIYGGNIAANYFGEYPGVAAHSGNIYALWNAQFTENSLGWIAPDIHNTVINIDQKLSSGFSSGIVGLGNNEISIFDNYSVPELFTFPINSSQTLRASQQIESNEKYHDWNNSSDVINHKTFPVDGTTSLISHLEPTYSGITIKSSLEGMNATGGSFYFKDPWYIDYADPLYGNNLRNRGTQATGPDELLFRLRPSPFNPDYNTSFTNGSDPSQSYKGVFLEQDYNVPGNPYYSVKVDEEQTIPINGVNHKFIFQNWSGTYAQFQYPNALETSVVFTDDNAVANAVLKGVQVSNNSTTYNNNGQRKIVRDNSGYYHSVYTSQNLVWYTKSSTTNFNGGVNSLIYTLS